MYIQYTFVHLAILLILQILGAVPLLVTSPFVVETLSLRLRSRLGLLHLSSNLLAVLLEVPLLPFALFFKLVVFVNHQHLMLFLISTFVDFSITKSLGITFVIPFGLSPLFPYGPIRPIYSPANSRNSPVLRKIPESLRIFPMSEYSCPIYRSLCLDHFETPRHVPYLIRDSELLWYIKTHKLII